MGRIYDAQLDASSKPAGRQPAGIWSRLWTGVKLLVVFLVQAAVMLTLAALGMLLLLAVGGFVSSLACVRNDRRC